ncbi:hypothetical protein CHS0354_033569 [Potamilus streckersoni]|uniref:GPI ethanolamine phosphate transferase 3, catalytic subunit n=1 Tax=Potamilus streckersoni TaxID=2493646 RepID=A0AAE0T0S5_9BIVA|nr:hypothetical protein CHS0354_033569 [Potamilus streckersoni]
MVATMGFGIKILATICYLLFFYIASVLIFTKGFLLKRVAIDNNSSCNVDFARSEEHGETGGCWMHSTHQRAIIVIIDALKFEFMVHHSDRMKNELPYVNKLPEIHNLLTQKPKHALLYKFIADPPTTTLQRLKGMTTGSLPTFVDAGSNFGSSEITEDNFIDQLIKRGKKVKFLGDDTWLGLFPGRFSTAFPFPSFNVHDLHTVDNGILHHLYTELKKKDWTLTVVHFLGVDHCGHRYGPLHPAMGDKLSQMNQVIGNITTLMEKGTVLFVLGDHGMTATGDHGGESPDEVEAGLFVYSVDQITASGQKHGDHKTISQIDFVPTISLLLGLPIPFSNLGQVVPELFDHCSWSKESHIKQVYHRVQALRLNALQISHYINAYMKISRDLPEELYTELQLSLSLTEDDLQKLVTKLSSHGKVEEVHLKFHSLEKRYITYIQSVQAMCRDVWAKFDLGAMTLGILTLLVAFVLTVYCIKISPLICEGKFPGSAACVFIASFVYIVHIIIQASFLEGGMVLFMAFILGLVDLGFIGIAIQKVHGDSKGEKFQNLTNRSNFELSQSFSFENLFNLFVITLSMAGYFSNSFVVYDSSISVFLTQTLILMASFKTVQEHLRTVQGTQKEMHGKKARTTSKVKFSNIVQHPVFLTLCLTAFCSLCICLTKNFQACREEQVNCINSRFLERLINLNSGEKNLRYFFSIVCLGILVLIPYLLLKHYGNLNGNSLPVLCMKYTIPLLAVFCALHWAVQGLPQNVLDSMPVWQQIVLPRIVHVFCIFNLLVFLAQPLLVYILPQNKSLSLPYGQSSEHLMHTVYRHIKVNWQDYFSNSKDKPPVVFGLGTVYTSGVLYIGTLVSLMLCLLLGDGMTPSVLLGWFSVLSFLEILSIQMKTTQDSRLNMLSGVLTFHLMTSVFFYGTGHQATIPSIRWEAAFVGFHGDFTNNIVPAILILFNTFAAQVLFTVLTPLILLWPYSKGIISSISLNNKTGKSETESEWKGDFVLFENEHKLKGTMMELMMYVILVNELQVLSAMCAATLHRRHLMVWKIFAPRFVFQTVSSFITFVTLLLVYLVILKIDSQLGKWLTKLYTK